MTANVKPYTWHEGDAEGIPGAMIRNETRNYLFLPMTTLIDVADALVDIVEQHEQKEN
ncbi:hypothetical protein [Kocuria sabuli]|uniref:hypothetical protein n=1 Tax=Kocuria sabuli TaxID=3071448 RepID=UPI0034D5A6A2